MRPAVAPYVPFATTLSLLIYAEKTQRHGSDGSLEFATYHVLDKAADLAGWSEDRRADLYTRIVEAAPVVTSMRFDQLQSAVTKAILKHNLHWRH